MKAFETLLDKKGSRKFWAFKYRIWNREFLQFLINVEHFLRIYSREKYVNSLKVILLIINNICLIDGESHYTFFHILDHFPGQNF